jgi:hypothetical protein
VITAEQVRRVMPVKEDNEEVEQLLRGKEVKGEIMELP